MDNQNLHATQANIGLNTESVITQVQPGQLTYALNAMVEGFDGMAITYQNEIANELCVTFPTGYKVVGVKNVVSIDTVYYFITNPTTGFSQIGYSTLNSCVYHILVDDSFTGSDKLNFNIAYPIHKVEVKTTNCSTQLYWTDRFNPRRYIDLGNLPWKDVIISGVITPLVGQIDANKLKVQPNFAVPILTPEEVSIGGNLIEGTYQFALQYADALGNGYTAYYSVTNEVRIFLDHKVSQNFNELTNKAITIFIDNLDTTGLYDYFNIAVIKSVNAIASVELVGTYYINGKTHTITYAGTEQANANIPLTIADIMLQDDYYDLAGNLCQVDNVLVWADLIKEDDFSYQKIWNKMPLQWETWKVPYNQFEGYTNGVNCANIQGYMRDEVYAFEGCFILANGKQTPRCHIPGRLANPGDLTIINNLDAAAATTEDNCVPSPVGQPRWKVYNTATLSGTHPTPFCKGPYQYGDMGYHESTEVYPQNVDVWGALSGQPIRHHRFPDSTITHIHDQNPYSIGSDAYNSFEHSIYPIGVKLDINLLRNAIASSPDLTQSQKDVIVGFKIMRGDRVANKSIVAKGLLYNCGKYTKDTSTYYYPNYPFNDVDPDPFISTSPVGNRSGANAGSRLHDFQQSRFTFHSPDTSFFRPSGIGGSFLKLETAEFGNCKAHFVPVKDNAGEKLRTDKDLLIAFAAAVASMIGIQAEFSTTVGLTGGVTTGVSPSFHPDNFFPTFNATLEILDKLMPYVNYGWQYNGIGYYGNYSVVPDNGSKIRFIDFGGYITNGLQSTFGDDHPINNTSRESAVYLSTNGAFPFAFQNTNAPADTSRATASQVGLCSKSSVFYKNVSSYYASVKKYLPGQWGQIFSYNAINTGYYCTFKDDNGNLVIDAPTIFGGDIFINRFALKRKHAFFNKSTVNRPDGTDIDYNQDALSNTQTGNVGFPIWYYSTSNLPVSVSGQLNAGVVNLANSLSGTFASILLALLTGGLSIAIPIIQIMIGLITDALLTTLGIKITNLECADYSGLHATGQSYLYAYGIPFYFVESEVNVDMRQATNDTDGNFYPNVASDIPDDWLAETNVKIIYDNIYSYNKTYSKQNKETFFATLRADWTENNPCFTNFNNRAIWSDKSSLEETKNNYVIYRPGATFDFPKNFGKLSNIDALANNQILVRFENKTQLYNALTTMQVSQGPAAYLGNTQMFSTIPLDMSHTDIGNVGSQHSMLLRTDYGSVWCDAKRGEVAFLEGGKVENLESKGMAKWFYVNLPFQILDYFPTVNIDNNFNGIGLHGVYDAYFGRIILTKKDYVPLDPNIVWDGENFVLEEVFTTPGSIPVEATYCCPPEYTLEPGPFPNGLACYPRKGDPIPTIDCGYEVGIPGTDTCCPDGYEYITASEGDITIRLCYDKDTTATTDPIYCSIPTTTTVKRIVELTDPKYFCNKSWTLSYSFASNSWISFHSYIPDYYIGYYSHFQSGRNDIEQTWDHDFAITNFNKYYGQTEPYILEYPFAYKMQDEILQNIKDFTTSRKYIDYLTFYEPEDILYFNKSIIYNGQQCTGILNLVPKTSNNLQSYMSYPIFGLASKDIQVVKSDNFFNYNTFWDIVKDKSQPIFVTGCDMNHTDKDLNQSNMDYTVRSHKKAQLRAKDCKVRHILDNRNDTRLISKFVLAPTVPSYK